MIEYETLCEKVSALFWSKLNIEVPTRETDLISTGYLDSLAFVELLLHLEQGFGVKFSVDDLELDSFRSIERIALFVQNHNGTKKPNQQ